MKRIIISAVAVLAISVMASCKDKLVTFAQLPEVARTYINTNFPDDKVVAVTVDDDLIRPDFDVRLSSGVELQFEHDGSLEKVASRNGISADLIPAAIREYVSENFPAAGYREYEIGRKKYEVKLTNGLELKFNNNFQLIEVDD